MYFKMRVTGLVFIATIMGSSQGTTVGFDSNSNHPKSHPLSQCVSVLLENAVIPVTLSTDFKGGHVIDGESIAVLIYKKGIVTEENGVFIDNTIYYRCDNRTIEEGYCEADEKDQLLYSFVDFTKLARCTKENVRQKNCHQNELGKHIPESNRKISGTVSAVFRDSKDYGQVKVICSTGVYCFKVLFNTTTEATVTFEIKDNNALGRRLEAASLYVYLEDFIMEFIGTLIFVGTWLLRGGFRKIPYLIHVLMGSCLLKVAVSAGLLFMKVKKDRLSWVYFFGPANRLVLTLHAFLYSSNFTFNAVPLDRSTVFCIILILLRRGALLFVNGHDARGLGIDYDLWYNIGNELGKYETWLERGIIPCWTLLRYNRKSSYYFDNNKTNDRMFRAFRLWIPCFVASVMLVLFKPVLSVVIFHIIENTRLFESRCFIGDDINLCIYVPKQIFTAVFCLLNFYPLIRYFLPRTYLCQHQNYVRD